MKRFIFTLVAVLLLSTPLFAGATYMNKTAPERHYYESDNTTCTTCTPCTNLNLDINNPIQCDHLCISEGGSSCCCWDMPDMAGGTMWITTNNTTFGTGLNASKGCVTLSPTTTTTYAFHYLNQAKTSGKEYPVTIYVVPPLEIESFKAVPPANDPDPYQPGKIWTLSWNVPNTVPSGWDPINVTIGIVCNGIPLYPLGSYPPDNYSTTITIPQGFNPAVSKNCQFCLTAHNCASCTPGASQPNLGDTVTKCVPLVYDNATCEPCIEEGVNLTDITLHCAPSCSQTGIPACCCWDWPKYAGGTMWITPDPVGGTLDPANGCIKLSPTTSTQYEFHFLNNTKDDEYTWTVNVPVVPPLEINSFTAIPQTNCNVGNNWTLSWDVPESCPPGGEAVDVSIWLSCYGKSPYFLGNYPQGNQSATVTIPQGYNVADNNCQFCLSTTNCARCPGDNITKCIPIVCDNCSSFNVIVEHNNICICEGDPLHLSGWVENPVPGENYIYTWLSPNVNFPNPVYSGPYEPVEILGTDLNDSGIYTLTVTNGKCSDNATVAVTICEKPDASIIVDKTSLCPMNFKLTAMPDNMKYAWFDSNGNYVSDEPKLKLDTTNWPEGDYTYTLAVGDSSCCKSGCTDNATANVHVEYAKCQNCDCKSAPIIIGCNPPTKCIDDPCGCENLTQYIPGWYWPKYCYPTVTPPPCPPPKIASFTATGVMSLVSPCTPGHAWDLNWHVDVANTQSVNWPPPGDATHPIYIALKYTDVNNNVVTSWGPQAFGPDGPYTCTLPLDFTTVDRKYEFCLWTYDCKGNQVMECQKICQDLPVSTSSCPHNCECMTQQEALDKGYTTVCSDKPCSLPGEPLKYCYSRCPEGCSCITQKEADDLGYTISCGDDKCDPSSKEDKYCFSPPLKSCSQSCQCLTDEQAKQLGYSADQRCQPEPCNLDGQGNHMYCYPKPKAPIVHVSSDQSYVTAGDEVKVCWKVDGEGITEVMFIATGEEPISVENSGCRKFRPVQQTRYLVTAKNVAGSGQDALTVGVGQPPVEEETCPTINSFTVDCPRIPEGTSVYALAPPCTLCWSVTGPAETIVSISYIGNVSMSGSMQVKRGETYVLTAKYNNCVRTATVQTSR